jgi:hypothetical protein
MGLIVYGVIPNVFLTKVLSVKEAVILLFNVRQYTVIEPNILMLMIGCTIYCTANHQH